MTWFQPNIAEDWDVEIQRSIQEKLPSVAKPDAERIETARRYNLSMPALSTPDIRRVWSVIQTTQEFNTYRSMGGRRLAVVDAPSHWGKTVAVNSLGLKQHREASATATPECPRPRPWAYVEASKGGQGRAIAQGIAAFLGVPFSPNESAAVLVDRLARIAPKIGLHTVFVDDVHFLRGAGTDERFQIANVLKHLLTAVPATFVLAGLNLTRSPMFARTVDSLAPSDQLANRADWTRLTTWPKTMKDGELNDQWLRLAANLAAHLDFPRGNGQCRLNRLRTLTYLIDGCGGRPGTAMEWTIRAANWAIQRDLPLDLRALRETRT